ncbi:MULTISPECIES: FHA domain-containing protein [Ramlibacter]|uniref:FHA domain-containing protein n=1 Tax=Ramlibacter pinisoli TaxID=2682844 RepID=A0A6N8IYC3_9BURK|nr:MULTISPECIES: FHA domain-containing protein [Ramlibacter]MBA2962068.1 FHA domain-containing protein [Ramlibacter sp. CGMCC 1.13660]MVQ32011.1 FHA domain-containing protein [Ramlibacter pinisoli]
MPAADSALQREAPPAAPEAPTGSAQDIVLKPLSRPELGDIRVDGVLAVGRAEQPFATFRDDTVVSLSRRHARLFCEAGEVYVADLGSSNGTTVNRAAVGPSPHRLRDGDEICFGGVLSYRVQIGPRTKARPDAFTLTLAPAAEGKGLETLVITRFPFLVSKTEGAFSQQRGEHAAQLSYLSRRHAHIFLKGGRACIEDLGSTNGTFVDGLRLQECAVPLQDGALLAFGGDHFTYRVGVTQAAGLDLPQPRELAEPAEPTRAGQAQPADNRSSAAGGKTTFVAAPTSFLDIFCVENALDESAEGSRPTVPAVAEQAPGRRPRRRAAALWSELASVFQGHDEGGTRRGPWRAVALVAVLAAAGTALYWWDAPDRQLKDLVASGDYAQAALVADRSLEQRPDDAQLKALSIEAALKANVPAWLAKVAARDFDGAGAVTAAMSRLGVRNAELRPLVAELEWLGQLERLVNQRGGPDQPIRIYADEDAIAALIDRWNNDTREHQRALARIASYVPQFGAPYAEALTHVRKLQSEASVHLGVIERLKTTIVAELKRDRPEALDPVLKEVAAKYPGLGGLDSVRQDLNRYLEIRSEARAGRPGRLFALVLKGRFATPPFQERFDALAASGQLPPAEAVRQYEAATRAWKEGQADSSLEGLRQMAAGPWAAAVQREVERRQAVLTRFAALQAARGASGYADQLLAFRLALDPEEDAHFARATQADLDQNKDKVLARAQDTVSRARLAWQDYRGQGGIEASQRSEIAVSGPFRARARLLADANSYSQQALQMHAQLGAAPPEGLATLHAEIKAEMDQQRTALRELRNVLEPDLLKSKLALLGDPER